MSEYQSQNNNYKISSSRESITNKGFGGLIIVRTTDVAFSTPTKIEKKKKKNQLFKEHFLVFVDSELVQLFGYLMTQYHASVSCVSVYLCLLLFPVDYIT